MTTAKSDPLRARPRPVDLPTDPAVSSPRRSAHYRDHAVDAASVFGDRAVVGMLCFGCVLFASFVDAGLVG